MAGVNDWLLAVECSAPQSDSPSRGSNDNNNNNISHSNINNAINDTINNNNESNNNNTNKNTSNGHDANAKPVENLNGASKPTKRDSGQVFASTKENRVPSDGTSRRRRKLPEPTHQTGNGKLRRAQSLSFLPSTGTDSNSNRPRRRLPDPGQGRLIQEVAEKLEEEAQDRLKIARELKDEKYKRWKLEDQVGELQAECKKFKTRIEERKRQELRMQREIDEERKMRHEAEALSQTHEKALYRTKMEIQRMREAQDQVSSDAMFGEEALKDAHEATIAEKKLRQECQEELEILKRGILKSGGVEVLQQLVTLGKTRADSPLMHIGAATPSPDWHKVRSSSPVTIINPVRSTLGRSPITYESEAFL
eukprot:m.116286 g.116286  ORF g.116286 m.116286 type:complete len:365 (+) comp28493_c0_seq2:277-1371(+)